MSFPNPLRDPRPSRLVLTGAGARLLLLLAMCLAPRIWIAARIEGVCPDGAFYIGKAQQLGEQLPGVVRDGYDFNFYTLLLAAWHRTGLSWDMAAKVWGVLAASLAVLPLFGLARRMFDERLALLIGALYAVHPRLVELSPEAVRDPTFWLLFTTSLYCSWRGVTEVRPVWFLAAGVATFLAAHTRFEGWFLFWPITLWCFWRWLALREARWRLAGGVVLLALGYPLVLGGLLYCHGPSGWEWTKSQRLELVAQWVRARWDVPTAPRQLTSQASTQPRAAIDTTQSVAAVGDTASSAHPSGDAASTAWLMIEKMGRAYPPTFSALALIGIIRWWRLCLRRDHLPYFLLGFTTLAAVWVHATEAGTSSTRYLMPLVILMLPLTAMGLLPTCRLTAKLAQWRQGEGLAPPLAAACALMLVLAVSTVEALTGRLSHRAPQAELGKWLAQESQSRPVLAGPAHWRLAGEYARAEYHAFPSLAEQVTPSWFGEMLGRAQPDAVVLCHRTLPAELVRSLCEQSAGAGLAPLELSGLPASFRSVTVLVRRPIETATQANAAAGEGSQMR
jgi:hypothetical protein